MYALHPLGGEVSIVSRDKGNVCSHCSIDENEIVRIGEFIAVSGTAKRCDETRLTNCRKDGFYPFLRNKKLGTHQHFLVFH